MRAGLDNAKRPCPAGTLGDARRGDARYQQQLAGHVLRGKIRVRPCAQINHLAFHRLHAGGRRHGMSDAEQVGR
ncbi:hypothetical protein SGGMMB4_04886 [Sodalis glossinidius str. 'morsitans']|uniref:Uncharacterized protein n=1 Tax=Sodalis glossinidius (strain morsitans) TaxID=343509 RepID=A0A193QML8_SODGM|nr:hypothetical protein [Sodalis glossinidius]CRL46343.1 hypothetical protein SGGMMB4_04886 [Sodalis glossinidius str. 'morsitans']